MAPGLYGLAPIVATWPCRGLAFLQRSPLPHHTTTTPPPQAMASARYTVQLHADSGNWAHPDGSDVRHAYSKREASDLLRDWAETVGRYDDARQASALIWRGDLDDVTDVYPDYQATIGPRLGVIWADA